MTTPLRSPSLVDQAVNTPNFCGVIDEHQLVGEEVEQNNSIYHKYSVDVLIVSAVRAKLVPEEWVPWIIDKLWNRKIAV